ncbi:DinB family protein [Paenibacillus senegalimassiliensis]|uniref:DinB family protein n=1 Tax=Paenibacillus senegalimassiliensis TaxID=1737426 RepID=UPI00073F5042|nr:DinB family protein [Paenibacillus senegalimassiliensis]
MSAELEPLLVVFKEWVEFARSLQEQSEDIWNSSLEEGKWTIKDIVCHIMLWDKYFYEEAVHKMATGQPVALELGDFDEFNKQAMVYAKTISIQELVDKAVFYREAIISDIRTMPAHVIEQNSKDPSNKFNLTEYLHDFIWHDQHHINPIKDFLN